MGFSRRGIRAIRRRTTMGNAPEGQPEPDRDCIGDGTAGSAGTDRVRPGVGVGSDRSPDHVPQLHRALSEAAADLDAVEDRLSTLFDRTEDAGGRRRSRSSRTAPSAEAAPAARADDDDDILELFADGDVGATDDDTRPGDAVADRSQVIGDYEDDIAGAFAELDAALAAEEPDEPARAKRRMFRRRANGASTAKG
jgi:hypothetical protein